MVKIKTSSDVKNKIALADLNNNIIQLTQALNKSTQVLNTNQIHRTSSTSSTKAKQSSSVTNEVWSAKDVVNMRSNVGSSIIGGLTGINPAIVQKLGLDKAIGSAFKNLSNTMKKKWAEAGKSSNSTKVNSAIEAHRISPITKRLDKIYGLLKSKKTTQIKVPEEKRRSLFGRLFSFLGSLGSLLAPLAKLAGIAALLGGIALAVKKIANWFGWKPGENPTTDVANVNALKDVAKLGRAGYEIGKGKVLNKARDIAQLRSTKKTAEAGAMITKLEEEAKRVNKARALAEEAREAGNIKRAERLENIADAKETKVIKDTQRIRELEARAAKDAAFARRVEQIKNSRSLAKTGLKVAGGFAVGTAIDAGASELAAWYLDKEGHHVEAESLRRQYKAVLPYNVIGTAGGAIVGGVVGGATTAGVGTPGGAIAGGNIGYAATDLTISELVRAKTNADTYKQFGEALPKPDHAEISPFRAGGDWYYYTKDQLERNTTAPDAKDELKRIWKRFNTDYTKDKEYEGHGLIDRLPDGLLKDWAYRLDHGIGTAFSALPETAGIGAAYLNRWWNSNKEQTLSTATPTTPVYGLTTDFNTPIQTADGKGDTMNSIEQNTRDTKDAVEIIAKVLQEGNDTMQSWKYNGSTSNTTSSVTAQNELTNDVPPFVTLRSIVGQGL